MINTDYQSMSIFWIVVGAAALIVLIGIAYSKWESRRATTYCNKKKNSK